MQLLQERIYTIQDIYALPDGQRAELIDGVFYMMAPPSTKHQEISGNLYYKIRNYIDSKKGKCKIYTAHRNHIPIYSTHRLWNKTF